MIEKPLLLFMNINCCPVLGTADFDDWYGLNSVPHPNSYVEALIPTHRESRTFKEVIKVNDVIG